MKILLVDDHQLFLDGFCSVLELQVDLLNSDNLNIIKASTVDEALELISQFKDIDLALVDLSMPTTSGINFIDKVNMLNDVFPIAVLSASEDIVQIRKVLSLGVLGFIPKAYGIKECCHALNHIMSGNIYLPETIQRSIELLDAAQESSQEIIYKYEITSRQLEIIKLLAKGLSNLQIAKNLYISGHTVKSHLKEIFQKLQCSNRINCINKAKLLGIID